MNTSNPIGVRVTGQAVAPPKVASPLREAIADLSARVEQNAKLIGELYDRLEGVTAPLPPEPGGAPIQATTGLSPTVTLVCDINVRVSSNNDLLQALIQRLQV